MRELSKYMATELYCVHRNDHKTWDKCISTIKFSLVFSNIIRKQYVDLKACPWLWNILEMIMLMELLNINVFNAYNKNLATLFWTTQLKKKNPALQIPKSELPYADSWEGFASLIYNREESSHCSYFTLDFENPKEILRKHILQYNCPWDSTPSSSLHKLHLICWITA